jgi:hypothetical protein
VGVTFDSLGINGARASTPLATDEAHFAEQTVHAAPALAIVAYGTNEAGDSTTTPDEHARALRALEGLRGGAAACWRELASKENRTGSCRIVATIEPRSVDTGARSVVRDHLVVRVVATNGGSNQAGTNTDRTHPFCFFLNIS